MVAAGNNANGYGDGSAYINSPGYAMNCITVGNLRTKSSGASGIGAKPYSLHPSSSWEEPNSLPSEPDICAPWHMGKGRADKHGDKSLFL